MASKALKGYFNQFKRHFDSKAPTKDGYHKIDDRAMSGSGTPFCGCLKAHDIPPVNKDLFGLDTVSVTVERGRNGFGFTVLDEFPVRVGRVDLASPAEEAGIHAGDYVIKVNERNVSRSTVNSVARLIKCSGSVLQLLISRPRVRSTGTSGQPAHDRHLTVPTSTSCRTDHLVYDSIGDLPVQTRPSVTGESSSSTTTSTSAATTTAQRRLQAVQQLLSLELDFVDFMRHGIRRYCRPLRHCIFTDKQHSVVFQNVEKLVEISEYHVQQMQDNALSLYPESDDDDDDDDDDDSRGGDDTQFVSYVIFIYHSKIHMLCHAHELYASGLDAAIGVLSALRHNGQFQKFLREPALVPVQPSISAFVCRPLQHIKELSLVFEDMLEVTSTSSSDYTSLRKVTHAMQEKVDLINNLSTVRLQSVTSLCAYSKTHVSDTGSCVSSSPSSSSSSPPHSPSTSSSSYAALTWPAPDTTSSLWESGSSSMSVSSSSDSCVLSAQSASDKDSGTMSGTHSRDSVYASFPSITPSQDTEMVRLSDRLHVAPHVPAFDLSEKDRHVIYEGDLFCEEHTEWRKVHVLLLTDMLVLCEVPIDSDQPDDSGPLTVVRSPLPLSQLCRVHTDTGTSTTQLVLHLDHAKSSATPHHTHKLVFRTPTPGDLATWKNILEHRLKTLSGRASRNS